jgi:hypothetical protein
MEAKGQKALLFRRGSPSAHPSGLRCRIEARENFSRVDVETRVGVETQHEPELFAIDFDKPTLAEA